MTKAILPTNWWDPSKQKDAQMSKTPAGTLGAQDIEQVASKEATEFLDRISVRAGVSKKDRALAKEAKTLVVNSANYLHEMKVARRAIRDLTNEAEAGKDKQISSEEYGAHLKSISAELNMERRHAETAKERARVCENQVKSLKSQLEEASVRENAHAGMCRAYETAIRLVATAARG